jgi:hypothetical protein
MIGRVGWRTATARTSGNHSSAWRYKTGASCRASVAPVSPCGSAPGGSGGTGGRRRRGPHPAQTTHSGIASTRTANWQGVTRVAAAFRPEPPLPPEWLVVYPRRSSCVSPVRRRTIPHRPCSSSHTTARDRHCRARPAPGKFSAIPSRSRRRRARTSRFDAPSVAGSQSTSRGPRKNAPLACWLTVDKGGGADFAHRPLLLASQVFTFDVTCFGHEHALWLVVPT